MPCPRRPLPTPHSQLTLPLHPQDEARRLGCPGIGSLGALGRAGAQGLMSESGGLFLKACLRFCSESCSAVRFNTNTLWC